MNIILVGKLLVGGVFTAIASTLAVLNWDKIIGAPYREIVVYAETESINDAVSEEIETKDDINKNNYQCRWAKITEQTNENKLFDCSIKKLKEDTSSSKKHFEHNSFELAKKEKLKTAGTIVQISFSSNKYDWKNDGTEKIEIVSTDTEVPDKGKKYGTADVWFVFDKDKEIKTTQFIGQADKTSTAGEKLSDYKCSWEKNEASKAETCQVYSFAASTDSTQNTGTEYSALTFKKDANETTEIKQHNYYRIVWTTNTEAKDNTNIIFAKATQSSGDTTTVATIKFEKVKPSFLVGDKIVVIKAKQPSSKPD